MSDGTFHRVLIALFAVVLVAVLVLALFKMQADQRDIEWCGAQGYEVLTQPRSHPFCVDRESRQVIVPGSRL